MTDIFLAPKQYIQAEGILAQSGKYLQPFGRRPLILGDSLVVSILRPALEGQLAAAGLRPSFVLFGEECSRSELHRLAEIVRQESLDFIVGTGGGKAIDTSRLLAARANLPLVTIPTSAATCSAASSVAVIYEKGIRQETINGKGADLALVDTAVLSRAPGRLLAAGMGDALSKWYEGKINYDQIAGPDASIQGAMNLSILLKKAILQHGEEAIRDVGAQKNSPAVEKIVETTILLTAVISGLGGSKFRNAVAHALMYGFTVLPRAHKNLHGEMVAFGIVVQLCMERNEKELETILPFFIHLGLPMTLQELGLTNSEDPLFQEGLRRTCARGSSVHLMPFPVNEKILYQGICEADERVRAISKNTMAGL